MWNAVCMVVGTPHFSFYSWIIDQQLLGDYVSMVICVYFSFYSWIIDHQLLGDYVSMVTCLSLPFCYYYLYHLLLLLFVIGSQWWGLFSYSQFQIGYLWVFFYPPHSPPLTIGYHVCWHCGPSAVIIPNQYSFQSQWSEL